MQFLAIELIEVLGGSCERIEVAGSVRRLAPWVSDLELVVISRVHYDMDMFGKVEREVSALDVKIDEMINDGRISVRSGNGPKNKLLIYNAGDEPLPVDIFLTTPANWGMAMAVRTGSKDFVKGFMARLQRLGHAGHAGGVARYCRVGHTTHTKSCGMTERPSSITLHRGSTESCEVMCETEAEVFDWAIMNWLDPQYRK